MERTNKIDLEAWANKFIESHKCSSCGGTGSVSSHDPYENGNVVCRECDGHGINGVDDNYKPTGMFLHIFKDIKSCSSMQQVNKIIDLYEKQIVLTTINWGVYRYYERIHDECTCGHPRDWHSNGKCHGGYCTCTTFEMKP